MLQVCHSAQDAQPLLYMIRAGIVPRGSDGLLPITLVLVGAWPTAMNISLIAMTYGTSQDARNVTLVTTYMYGLAIFSVSLWASAGLILFL